MTIKAFKKQLIDTATAPYRQAGRFAWHFARGKLGGDPVFLGLLRTGVIAGDGRILDLGCGQGLLASWLRSAGELFERGDWPAGWPPPPRPAAIRGIELMPKDIERARRAVGDLAEFVQGDIRTADFGHAEVVVILDVLHYIDHEAQEDVLRRVWNALPPGGTFVTRVGDADGGLPFRLSNLVDFMAAAARGHHRPRFWCRPLSGWKECLVRTGFSVETLPMSDGTPYANVMLIATRQPAAPTV